MGSRGPLALAADSGPVLVLAGIAAAGSFTHIRDTATDHGQHGWMSWAIAVCIDLTCVMAARERQRDKRTGRAVGALSWPTLVLIGGILLSLAANLAQAEPSPWGWAMAATPAGAFLVAVSMLERRASVSVRPRPSSAEQQVGPPPSWGRPDQDGPSPAPSLPSPAVPALDPAGDDRPELPQDGPDSAAPVPGLVPDGPASPVPVLDEQQDETGLFPTPDGDTVAGPAPELLDFARRVAAEHHAQHGRPITRDALRARLGVSNQLASDLLRHIRN